MRTAATAERILGSGEVDEYALAAGYWCVVEANARTTAFVVTRAFSGRIEPPLP